MTYREATHLAFDEKEGCLVFFWHEPEAHWHASKLYKPMTAQKAADYAWEWLDRVLRSEEKPKLPEPVRGAFRVKAGGEFRFYWKAKHSHSPDDGSSYGIAAVWPTWQEIHQ